MDLMIRGGKTRTLKERICNAVGLSDGTLLIPALARPQQLYAYANPLDIIRMATAYAASIVRNH